MSKAGQNTSRPPPEDERAIFLVPALKNNKIDVNNRGAVSTDYIGASWTYPEASYEIRTRIWQDHIDYTAGLFYFLANDPRVPEPIQKEILGWGLCADEFADTNQLAPSVVCARGPPHDGRFCDDPERHSNRA